MPISVEDQLHSSRTLIACMTCLLAYDSVIQLPKEWRIIWNERHNIGVVKACYVINKYCGIAGMLLSTVSSS